MLSRDDLLGLKPQTVKAIELPDGLGSVGVRLLSNAEVEQLTERQKTAEKAGKVAADGLSSYLVSLFVCDEDGTKIFTETDLDALNAFPFKIAQSIIEQGMDFNGLSKDSADALEKN